MRHHGLPTQPLDWSESVLVAAYFTCRCEPEKEGAIWGLSPGSLNEQMFGKSEIALQAPRRS
jgi:hypothetical protein